MKMENKDYKTQVKINLLDDAKYFQFLQEKYMKIVRIKTRNKLKNPIYSTKVYSFYILDLDTVS